MTSTLSKLKLGAKIISWVSALAITLPAIFTDTPGVNPEANQQIITVDTSKLEKQIADLSKQIKKQNQFKHRLLLGLAAGAGTALGATVVAALVLILLRPVFNAVGLDNVLPETLDLRDN